MYGFETESTETQHNEHCKFYRYEDSYYDTFVIVKKTNTGVWVIPDRNLFYDDSYEDVKKFINFNWTKQYARKTKKEAQEAFTKRKEKQLRILKARLEVTEAILKSIKNGEYFDQDFYF